MAQDLALAIRRVKEEFTACGVHIPGHPRGISPLIPLEPPPLNNPIIFSVEKMGSQKHSAGAEASVGEFLADTMTCHLVEDHLRNLQLKQKS